PFLFCTVPPPTAISSLSLPDALPLSAPEAGSRFHGSARPVERDRPVRDIQSAAASTTRTPRIPMTEAAPRVRARLSTPARVLIALLLGAAVGLLLAAFDPVQATRVADAVQPIGRLWLNALQMTVVPLVAALVVVGINSAADAAASGRTARTAIVVFLALLALSGAFAAIAAPTFLSLVPRDEALIATFRAAIQAPENLPD